MSTPVAVNSLDSRSHDTPDEVRTPAKTRVEVVRMEGYTLGRLPLRRTRRWSECLKPVVGTDSCQLSHVGYAVSGQLEDFVGIEVISAEQFAKPAN